MTAIVGILCTDGVVVGADSSSTSAVFNERIIEQTTEKIEIIENKIILTATGSVGLKQRYHQIIQDFYKNHLFSKIRKVNQQEIEISHIQITKDLCRCMLDDMNSTHLKPGGLGALLAFPLGTNQFLCEFAVEDFQPEIKTPNSWFVSMGSTIHITDSFLAFLKRVFWEEKQPDLADGIFAATWTIQHAIDVNPGGVNGPISIATLSRNKKGEFISRKLERNEMDEHQQNIDEAKSYMRKYLDQHRLQSIRQPPMPPQSN
ncbi:MAG: hypothetical protein ACE15F_13390 [bacterium]